MTATQKDGLKQAAEQFRDQQAAAITMLKAGTPGLTIDVLDVHAEFLKIVAKPGDFGLTNVTQGVVNVTNTLQGGIFGIAGAIEDATPAS